MNSKKALFLDRDGVINEDMGYVSKCENFVFIDGIFESLKEFAKSGYTLIIITNQSGIGRGYYSLEDFEILNKFMLEKFKSQGINIAKVCFCPHAPESNCQCRKPKPKMILDSAKEFDIDLKKSIMIGDKQSDMDAAINAGVGRHYLLDGIKFKNVRDVFNLIKKEKTL
ncbi:MAG: D-glycero-beta-D-manno-heptose 1,7-bisphosphate 7-phosphatase [Campylobacter sp.]|nr:D-glycero-beta-D-manno-heptose 1,7-bisphosphate 7-phosphatase [Campylobacter sp.]